ncbi:syndecan-1-like isoform X2 [Alosa sapidissima]|uniref:syndecan-1-like isoform X2 n=1 Tax=Alosa sapidissima TaxID=34773 RepID=UPI001C091AFF|nr:syndecan-1-like isoform X2 [Alosa sapidissima]
MRIHLTRIGLLVFYISSLVSALSSSTNIPPEDLDTSGDDAEFSGSGSGSGEDDLGNVNGGQVTLINVTETSSVTDAPFSTVQQTTEKIPIAVDKSRISVSLSPVTTIIPPMETSDSDTLHHHTTHIHIHDTVEGKNTTTPPAEKVDITTLVSGTKEKVTVVTTTLKETSIDLEEEEGTTTTTTTAAVVIVEDEDGTSVPEEEATDMRPLAPTTTSSAPIDNKESTTASVSGSKEKVTVVTTTLQETSIDLEEEEEVVEGTTTTTTTTTTAAVVTVEDEDGTSVPEEDYDEATDMPPLAPTTTAIVDIIVPKVRKGVERPKPDEDFVFANDIRRTNTKSLESSSDHQTLLERKEVLAGVICGGIVGLALAVMLVSIMAYRMKKKDEGSYALEDHKPFNGDYQKVQRQEEFLA